MSKEWGFQALTNVWTGSAARNSKFLVNTGLLGSIRWWFEVLVRGLGGYACDPTNKDVRCKDADDHCVVCELFGCTDWARKFRFEVRDNLNEIQTMGIMKDDLFSLHFTTLRQPIGDEGWTLLDATLRLIEKYGAIGGKTIFKPTDEENRKPSVERYRRGEIHHQDFGLIKKIYGPRIQPVGFTKLTEYISSFRCLKGPPGGFAWASLRNFWFVNDRHLSRQNANHSTFNKIIGRPLPKSQAADKAYDSWLSGGIGKSKKVFSFENPKRTFGFVRELSDLPGMKAALQAPDVWPAAGWSFLKYAEIIKDLFPDQGGAS